MTTCGEVLVTLLERYGVDHVFGIPGVHTVELYRGLADSAIHHITPRHEQGAGFMADGYARTSGKPGVCFIITGPGMTNIATAMAQAYADSIPMLVISSVQARSQLGGGRGKLHELPSQQAMVAGFSAFSHTLMSPRELPEVLARAFAVFHAARPRPVHIEIPLDVLVENADALLSHVPPTFGKPGADSVMIERMASVLAQARRPLILAGGGAINATGLLTELTEVLAAPMALTINAKGVLPGGHPLLIGSTQSLAGTRALVVQADVVLAIGTELAETDYDVTFAGGFDIPGKLLRVDIEADQTMRNHMPFLALIADAQAASYDLLVALKKHVLPEREVSWGQAAVVQLNAINRDTWDRDTQVQTHFLHAVLRAIPNAIIVGDSTQPVYAGNVTLDMAQPRSWFNSSTGYGTLGYALPAAIGARLGGARPVVCLIGDGGLQFTLPELASAVEVQVPLIVLVWNNHGYGEIKKYMLNRSIAPVGVDIFTPDFVAIAKGLGCQACQVADHITLTRALEKAQSDSGVHLIEINQATWQGANP